jgi:hypothetical protein
LSSAMCTNPHAQHDPEKWVPAFRKDHAPPKISPRRNAPWPLAGIHFKPKAVWM